MFNKKGVLSFFKIRSSISLPKAALLLLWTKEDVLPWQQRRMGQNRATFLAKADWLIQNVTDWWEAVRRVVWRAAVWENECCHEYESDRRQTWCLLWTWIVSAWPHSLQVLPYLVWKVSVRPDRLVLFHLLNSGEFDSILPFSSDSPKYSFVEHPWFADRHSASLLLEYSSVPILVSQARVVFLQQSILQSDRWILSFFWLVSPFVGSFWVGLFIILLGGLFGLCQTQ